MNKKMILEMLETAREALANGGRPVIYRYGGKIGISRGDQIGGTVEPVYNNKAEILIDTDGLIKLLNPFDYDSISAIERLADILED